ncbi:MAG: inversin [Candidatus Dependentiae bacterium]|nr:inversin [Candidatus Dependentiae bacterium]
MKIIYTFLVSLGIAAGISFSVQSFNVSTVVDSPWTIAGAGASALGFELAAKQAQREMMAAQKVKNVVRFAAAKRRRTLCRAIAVLFGGGAGGLLARKMFGGVSGDQAGNQVTSATRAVAASDGIVGSEPGAAGKSSTGAKLKTGRKSKGAADSVVPVRKPKNGAEDPDIVAHRAKLDAEEAKRKAADKHRTLQKSLSAAADALDIATIEKLVREGADMSERTTHGGSTGGTTPAYDFVSALSGKGDGSGPVPATDAELAYVDKLLAANVDLGAQSTDLLMAALNYSNHTMFAKLLAHKAIDVSRPDSYGTTPLADAIVMRNVPAVRGLLSRGADRSVVSKQRNGTMATPLALAQERLANALKSPLYDSDDDETPEIVDYRHIVALLGGAAPIEPAAAEESVDAVERARIDELARPIFDQMDLENPAVGRGRGALRDMANAVEDAIKKADPAVLQGRDKRGNTLMHTILHTFGGSDLVNLLIEKGLPDIDVEDKDHVTPLVLAARTGNKKAAEALIAAGADSSRVDSNGVTVLHYAARSGIDEVVRGWSSNDADVQTDFGATALHYAADCSEAHGRLSEDRVKLLLEKKINRALKMRNGMTAQDVARAKNKSASIIALLEPTAEEIAAAKDRNDALLAKS